MARLLAQQRQHQQAQVAAAERACGQRAGRAVEVTRSGHFDISNAMAERYIEIPPAASNGARTAGMRSGASRLRRCVPVVEQFAPLQPPMGTATSPTRRRTWRPDRPAAPAPPASACPALSF